MKRWQGVGQVLWMLSARVQVVGSSKVSFCTMAMWKKTHISIYIYLWYLYIYWIQPLANRLLMPLAWTSFCTAAYVSMFLHLFFV